MNAQNYTFARALKSNRPLIIAHRGSYLGEPVIENTRAAFQRAIEKGADGIELDVRLTRDKQLVVFHDPSLLRLGQRSDRINHLTRSQLAQLPLHGDNPAATDFAPSLEEVLHRFGHHTLLNLELKAPLLGVRLMVQELANLVSRYGVEERVWVSSFHPLAVWHCKKALPRVFTALLFTRWNPVIRWFAHRPWIDVLHPEVSLLRKLDALRSTGKPLFFWTVNDALVIRKLLDAQVAGLITDAVELASQLRNAMSVQQAFAHA